MYESLKYPILLVHGMGFRDSKHIGYWGRIPKNLEELGCKIYHGNQDANGTIESNGEVLANRVREIIAESGADKLNVIAHSKGGLDMRYAISSFGISEHIASLTTIGTPHNGSLTVDRLLKLPKPAVKFVSACADIWLKICGDKTPDTYKVINAFTTASAADFNRNNPDSSDVYYQSYAFVMKHVWSDIIMILPSMVVKIFEGQNDGLLAPRAVEWTNFRGIITGNSGRGISHCDEVDLRRRHFSRKNGDGVRDITEFYVSIVNELKEKGF